ncbi:SKAP1 isoform 5, partial [Pan troglodytes]
GTLGLSLTSDAPFLSDYQDEVETGFHCVSQDGLDLRTS